MNCHAQRSDANDQINRVHRFRCVSNEEQPEEIEVHHFLFVRYCPFEFFAVRRQFLDQRKHVIAYVLVRPVRHVGVVVVFRVVAITVTVKSYIVT